MSFMTAQLGAPPYAIVIGGTMLCPADYACCGPTNRCGLLQETRETIENI